MASYLTAPLWLVFLLVGILISLQAEYVRPEYFPKGASLFPQWPAQDPVRAAYVFAGTMAMLLVPKLIGWLAACGRRSGRYGMGGLLRGLSSLLLEIVLSALIAPIMMLKQCRAVIEILLGRDAGWSVQRREESESLWADAVRFYSLSSLTGAVFAAVAYAVSIPLLIWMLPVILGLVLAIPLVWLTGRPEVGEWARRCGFLLTLQERSPPDLLLRVNELVTSRKKFSGQPIRRLLQDSAFRQLHLEMLGAPAPRKKGEIDIALVAAVAKIEDSTDAEEALALMDEREAFAMLANSSALRRLVDKALQGRCPRGDSPLP